MIRDAFVLPVAQATPARLTIASGTQVQTHQLGFELVLEVQRPAETASSSTPHECLPEPRGCRCRGLVPQDEDEAIGSGGSLAASGTIVIV